jgi:CRISPR-associated protein Csd1
MILQALKDYYDRKAADPDSGIAPEGFEHKEIPFVIVLDREGGFVQIEDTRRQVGKQLRARAFLVPQSEKRTVGVKANLLWDNAEYVLGICVKGNADRVRDQHRAFTLRISDLAASDDAGVKAVLKFLAKDPVASIETFGFIEEIKQVNPFMAFRLNEDDCLVCERAAIVAAISGGASDSSNNGICLVSGESGALANLQPSIKGVRDTNTTGGNIVSFNLSAFNSYGKTQGGNAPIGEQAAFAYTTALNHLLGKDSAQKLQIGDATTVFWSDRKSDLESDFCSLFDEPKKDNPDALTDAVKALYKSVDTGAVPAEDREIRFFVLGLSPNAARISVRFWQVGAIADFSKTISAHFKGLEIIHAPHERDHLSLWWLLTRISAQGETKNIPPNLAGDWMRAIMSGTAYPETLFQAALRRINAERDVTYPRAAIIKSCLNRKSAFQISSEKEITVSLDKENSNAGYRLGRLFAVLEKIQEDAQPGINATIRDRYYSAASGTPASVMPILMRLKNHHLGKLEKGRSIYFERLLGEILGEVADFPANLNLQDQGRFAIGYYHQRQDFFIKQDPIN